MGRPHFSVEVLHLGVHSHCWLTLSLSFFLFSFSLFSLSLSLSPSLPPSLQIHALSSSSDGAFVFVGGASPDIWVISTDSYTVHQILSRSHPPTHLHTLSHTYTFAHTHSHVLIPPRDPTPKLFLYYPHLSTFAVTKLLYMSSSRASGRRK